MSLRKLFAVGIICIWLCNPATAQAGERSDMPQTFAHVISAAEAHAESLEVVEAMSVVTAVDGKSGSVHFLYAGELRHYDHIAVSVYSDDAVALRRTDQGDLSVLPRGQPRTFRSYANGAAAAMSIHKDGYVSGLFEVDGQLMQIRPAREPTGGGVFEAVSKPGNKHTIQRVNVSNFILRGLARPSTTLELGKKVSDQNNWSGTRWFPGCYAGDRVMHKLVIGMVSDVLATEYRGNASAMQDFFEDVTNEASFIYEHQMNFMLQLGYTHTYERGASVPNWAADKCAGDFMDTKLRQLRGAQSREEIPYQGATHLWTGCGDGWGTVGLAYVGTACRDGSNTGVDQVKAAGGSLLHTSLTFAHELGHNLGAGHSFEEGQGHTGGIMDYGDGKVDGWYQFNTKHRKAQVCAYLNKMATPADEEKNIKAFCRGKFTEISWFEWLQKHPTLMKLVEFLIGTLVLALFFGLSLQPCCYTRCLKKCPKVQKCWVPFAKKLRECFATQCSKLCSKDCMCGKGKPSHRPSKKTDMSCKKCMDALLAPFRKLQELACGKSKRKPVSWPPKKGGNACGQCIEVLLTPFRKLQDCLSGKKGPKKRSLCEPLLRA